MSGPRRRLRSRLMLAFAGFTLLVAALFGLYATVFAYTVEDAFFRAMLEQEAQVQQQHRAETGQWAMPRDPVMTVVEDIEALPDGIAAILRDEPRRTEFSGREGRHYHLLPLADGDGSARAWLLAEVSRHLVVRPMRAELLQLLAWSGAVVVALALLLGGWLAGRTTAPLERLAAQVDAMRPDRLPARLSQDFPDDEVGVLARGLDALIRRVDDFVTREREFTRDASHELRTPLAVIRSACERLADESVSAAGRRQLEHVRQSAWQLEQTVSTLLSLAREERQPGSAIATAVLPIVERVVVEQAPQLDGKPVEVDVRVPADARLTLPAPVLHILLSNLVGNAFAHTPRGLVRIDAGRLRIANPGGEISDVDFAPHVKGEASHGFGLGLAIVRRLCERHDLDLRIETRHGTGAGHADGQGAGITVASLALDQPMPGLDGSG
jgi:signal transduction histidine kinase